MKGIRKLRLWLQSMSLPSNRTSIPDFQANPNLIQEPMFVLTKRAPRQPKRPLRKKGKCSQCNNHGHTVRTCTQNLSIVPTNIYSWNDCNDHISDNGIEESDASAWTNIYFDGSSEHAHSQASGSRLNNSQSIGITKTVELNLFGSSSSY